MITTFAILAGMLLALLLSGFWVGLALLLVGIAGLLMLDAFLHGGGSAT